MRFEQWERLYLEIIDFFGYSREEDELSARILDELLNGNRIADSELERLIMGKDVSVIGNAPSLEKALDASRPAGTIIAADQATSVLMKRGIVPDIITTDLDGEMEDQIEANNRGAVVIVHAHGDNMELVKRWAPRFRGNVVGTTQSTPFGPIRNFGGFTDGDRAVFLADHFGAKRITLIGFDFDNVNEEDEKKRDTKLKKLDWAYVLIEALDNPDIVM